MTHSLLNTHTQAYKAAKGKSLVAMSSMYTAVRYSAADKIPSHMQKEREQPKAKRAQPQPKTKRTRPSAPTSLKDGTFTHTDTMLEVLVMVLILVDCE